MQIEDLQAIQDETEQIQALYRIYDEDSRLSCSQAAQVEFLTNTYYIEQYLLISSNICNRVCGFWM